MAVCFWLLSVAVFTISVLWIFNPQNAVRPWTAAIRYLISGIIVALVWGLITLVYYEELQYWGAGLLCWSFILICVMERRSRLLPARGRAVLITGCDSGFGNALAKRLSDEGVTVFAGFLDVNGDGARQLRDQGPENLHVLQLDVTDGSQIEAVHRYICTHVDHTGLWGLVNNAGVLQCPTDAEIQPLNWCTRCMDVNFLSAVRTCQVFLPLLRRSQGRIINISSMAGEVPMPMFASYGASKAALSIFSRVLRMEMSEWGVSVVLIQPSGFRTNIFGNTDNMDRYREEILASASAEAIEDYGNAYISSLPSFLSKLSQQSSEDLSPVVDDMIHALLSVRPRAMYTPGRMAWLLPVLYRFSPTAMFESLIRTQLKANENQPAGLMTSSIREPTNENQPMRTNQQD